MIQFLMNSIIQGENIADNGGLKEAYRAYSQCLGGQYGYSLSMLIFQSPGSPDMVWSPGCPAYPTLRLSSSGWARPTCGALSTGPRLSTSGSSRGFTLQTSSESTVSQTVFPLSSGKYWNTNGTLQDLSQTWRSSLKISSAQSGRKWTLPDI